MPIHYHRLYGKIRKKLLELLSYFLREIDWRISTKYLVSSESQIYIAICEHLRWIMGQRNINKNILQLVAATPEPIQQQKDAPDLIEGGLFQITPFVHRPRYHHWERTVNPGNNNRCTKHLYLISSVFCDLQDSFLRVVKTHQSFNPLKLFIEVFTSLPQCTFILASNACFLHKLLDSIRRRLGIFAWVVKYLKFKWHLCGMSFNLFGESSIEIR